MTLPISVIILTYNEENNIEDCLNSLTGWIREIFIVDSYSTDRTLQIAEKYTDKIYQHHFENYSRQRNWALETLPIKTDWIMNIDADHRITAELKNKLLGIFSDKIDEEINGYIASRRTIFMGRWIHYGGHYPVYHAFLFRRGFGICENKLYDQHFLVKGRVEKIPCDIIDIISDSITRFTERHNHWASLEASEQLISNTGNRSIVEPRISGHEIEKRRYKREIYYKLPLFARAFLFFIYRYIFKLGFLDGKEGLIFHFLQGFWFRFLIDAKLYEIKKQSIKK